MANKKTTNSQHFDFLPNKQNKYSIRKFAVGTASILVGATLVFGAYNDVQAEELDNKATEDSASTEEASIDEKTTDEETATEVDSLASEEEATSEAPTETDKTTEKAATADKVDDATEADTSAEEATDEKVEDTVTAPDTSAEELLADTTPAVDTQATSATTSAATEQPEKASATDIKTVTDQASAADYLAAEKNISSEEANKIVSNLNGNLTDVTPEALQQALVDYLANEQNKYNIDGTLAAVREETALTNENVVVEKPLATSMLRSVPATATRAATTNTTTRAVDSALQQEAQKDAIYAPGQKGQHQGYEGKAWIYRGGNINNPNEAGAEPLPNTKIYLQWVNGKGFVSPVYYTITNPDGSYVFDLSQPIIDSTGKEQKFQLAGDDNFAVRTWVENPDPKKYNVIKHGDQKYGFHTRVSRTNESWDFTAGINRIVNGQVLVQEKTNQNDWLMKPKDQWTTSPNADGIWPNDGAYGKVSGTVWYETNDPSGSDSRAWKKDTWDVNATGVKVVASYVNDEVTRQFDEWKKNNKGYTIEDFKAAQAEIVKKYQAEHGVGSHIAETVVGTVDEKGEYYIPFKGLYGVSATQQNSGAKISHKVTDDEYGQLVKDEDVAHNSLLQWNGTIGQKHRHINSDYMYITPMIEDYAIWGNNYQNNMFTSASTGADIFDAKMLAAANGANQNFAALAPQPMHDILVYDSTDNFATPGDTVESKSGGLLPSHEYQVQWFKDGVAIGDPVSKVSGVDGTLDSVPITVPADLDKNATYTSAIFLPNTKTTELSDALAVDSFTAVVDQNIIHEPAYKDTTAKVGEKASVTPTFTKKNGNEVATSDVPLATDNPFKIDPNAENVPAGINIDPKTGEITITPTKDQVGKDFTVPVIVTYADGTTDTVEAKFTVKEGTPDADKYDPKATPEVVEKGGKVDLTDNVDLTKLPEGTKVADVTPAGTIDTNKPGDYTGKVEVTYPDGSKDTVDVPVTVKASQADENEPKVTPEVVEKGGKVDLTDNVDLTKLPEGTKVADVTPAGTIDTNKPGGYTGKVEVTYPDGSKDTVDVPVTVKEAAKTQADENEPKVTPEVVEKGGKVDLTDNVDLTKLPEGTTVKD
ncbi:Rib/alpha-like domain-containing protein, partial [Staphylococcus americanisciuri]|uniref:Rib/alpha-like domain-containing protein n=1 Tax=Staphylococcus americanisciuri TaxID=2973940 RepID=UPI00278C0B18